MKLKIETAEDLIKQSALGHTVCGPAKSINWVTNDVGIVIVCGCGLEMTLTFNYLIEELGVNALADVQKFISGNVCKDRKPAPTPPARKRAK